MKNKYNANAVLLWSVLASLSVFLFPKAFAADAAQPSVQLGAVAQRYPWNGTLDVMYKASGLPATGTNAVVTVTANGKSHTQGVTISNGTNTVAFTELPKDVRVKDAKVKIELKK